jgi:hypothetical protein
MAALTEPMTILNFARTSREFKDIIFQFGEPGLEINTGARIPLVEPSKGDLDDDGSRLYSLRDNGAECDGGRGCPKRVLLILLPRGTDMRTEW